MSVDCYGIVLNVSWDFETFNGKATVLIYSRYSAAYKTPWASSAITNVSAGNGGWNASTYCLTLSPIYYGDVTTDYEDGRTFAAGDVVSIVERAPSNAQAATAWANITVDKTYETDGGNLLTLATGTTLTGWNAQLEYIIIPSEYAATPSNMHTNHPWQCTPSTFVIGTDKAKKYG
jgi:hypothetical protein